MQARNLPNSTLKWLHENYIEPGKLGNKSDKGGLYPPAVQGHGRKIIALNIYQGSYPGELPREKQMSSGQILEVPLNNKSARPVALVTGQKLPDGIDVADRRMYWTSMGSPGNNDGAVYSAKLDGSDIETVIPVGKVHTPKQLHIDAKERKLYFCDREGLRIHRSNLDGSEHEIIVQTGDWKVETDKVRDQTYWPVGVTVSSKLNKIFWTQKGGSKAQQGRILSAALNLPAGSNAANRKDIEVVAQGLPEPIDLEFDDDNGVLYWTDRGEIPFGNTLNKKTLVGQAPASESGSGRQIIAHGFGEAIGLRLDKEKQLIYVADMAGRLWECGTTPGPKTKIYEASGHAYTGLALVEY